MLVKPAPFWKSDSVDNDLVMEWTTASDGDSIELTSWSALSNDYNVDWGDSSSETNVTDTSKTHTYTTAGTYEVRIKSSSTSFSLNMSSSATSNRVQLTKFKNWGNVALQSVRGMFTNSTAMVYEATDYPNLTALSSVSSSSYKSANQMFRGCFAITQLDVSNWQNVDELTYSTSWQYFAYDCKNMQTFNASNLVCAASCTSFVYFAAQVGKNVGCNITMDDCSFTGVTDMSNFFTSAKANTIFSTKNWILKNASGGTNTVNLFYNVDSNAGTGDIDLDLSGWTNTSCVNSFSNTFRGCDAFGEINMSNWDTSNVTTLSYMFYGNNQVTKIEGLEDWNSSSVTTMTNAFYLAYKLSFPTSTSNFGTAWGTNLGSCTNFSNTFNQCGKSLPGSPPDVSNWDMSGATTIAGMFNTSKFTSSIDPSNWNVSSLTGSQSSIFLNMDGLSGALDLSAWNFTNAVTHLTNFARGTDITSLTFSNSADFSGVINMSYFGYVATNLTTLTFGASVSFASCTTWVNAFTSVTLDIASYDALLIRNDATNSNTPVTLTAGTSSFTCAPSAAATAEAALVALGWTINDAPCT